MDSKKLLKIALIVILFGGFFYVYRSYNPAAQDTFFVPCPIKLATGFNCPGCGSQRAIHQLLHFNIKDAFKLNPFMVLSLPLVIWGLGTNIWNYIFETRYRVKLFYSNLFIYSYFGIALLYWILRNLPYYPFNLMAPTE